MNQPSSTDENLLTKEKLLHISGEFEMESIQFLNLQNQNLQSLGDVNKCSNLIRINVSRNQISKLNPLRDLKMITTINVSCNQITSLEPLANLTALVELNAAGNLIGSLDRLRCLADLSNLKKFRLQDKLKDLTNPVCTVPAYHDSVMLLLQQIISLDGVRVRGRGSEFYKTCCELDKQLESLHTGTEFCPCGNCEIDCEDGGRTFGPVVEKPIPGPWLPLGYLTHPNHNFICTADKALNEFNNNIKECKKLNDKVASKIHIRSAKDV